MNKSNNNLSKMEKHNQFHKSENKTRFTLETQKDDDLHYQPENRQFSFYQICKYSVDKKHHVRKVIYNELGDPILKKESHIDTKKIEKFLKKCPTYKFTIYPAYNLDIVGMPEDNEILTAKSQILNEY